MKACAVRCVGCALISVARQLLGAGQLPSMSSIRNDCSISTSLPGSRASASPVVGRGGLRVVLAARHPPGQIAAEQRARLDAGLYVGLGVVADARCGRQHTRGTPQPKRCRQRR